MGKSLIEVESLLAGMLAEAPDAMRPYVGIPGGPADVCPYGTVQLDSLLFESMSARLYEGRLVGHDATTPDDAVIIKYASDCSLRINDHITRHPLYTDAIFLGALYPSGLVVKPIYVSPASPLPRSLPLDDRHSTLFIRERFEKCVGANAQIRFLVLEKAGVSLDKYLQFLGNTTGTVDWNAYAVRTIALTIRVIELLQEMHDSGVVHGDIHGGNILFRKIGSGPESVGIGDTDLVFVDFELAEFFPDQIGTPTHKPRRDSLNPRLLSPWNLWGQRIGRRDDIYRALEMMAEALSMGSHFRHFRDMMHAYGGDAACDTSIACLKDVFSLFEYALDPMAPGKEKADARRTLHEIASDHLDSLDHPDTRPDYDGIVALLETLKANFETLCTDAGVERQAITEARPLPII